MKKLVPCKKKAGRSPTQATQGESTFPTFPKRLGSFFEKQKVGLGT